MRASSIQARLMDSVHDSSNSKDVGSARKRRGTNSERLPERKESPTVTFTPPSVENLINNLPEILKSSRQFLPWNLEKGDKKVPLKENRKSWGDYRNPKCWRTFDEAIEMLDRRQALGIGLVLPSQEHADMHPDFHLITGLVAIDGDAKRSTAANPVQCSSDIAGYVNAMQTYSEFSTSLKGLRALAFGTIPTKAEHHETLPRWNGNQPLPCRLGHVIGPNLLGLGSDDRTPTGSLGSIIRRVVASTECR